MTDYLPPYEQKRREDFLAKAQHADEQAAATKGKERESWRMIAAGYRELAEAIVKRFTL